MELPRHLHGGVDSLAFSSFDPTSELYPTQRHLDVI
jgi:hypothetical protein